MVKLREGKAGFSGSSKFFSISGAPLWLRAAHGPRLMQRDAQECGSQAVRDRIEK
jgi:hypothetical protein